MEDIACASHGGSPTGSMFSDDFRHLLCGNGPFTFLSYFIASCIVEMEGRGDIACDGRGGSPTGSMFSDDFLHLLCGNGPFSHPFLFACLFLERVFGKLCQLY